MSSREILLDRHLLAHQGSKYRPASEFHRSSFNTLYRQTLGMWWQHVLWTCAWSINIICVHDIKPDRQMGKETEPTLIRDFNWASKLCIIGVTVYYDKHDCKTCPCDQLPLKTWEHLRLMSPKEKYRDFIRWRFHSSFCHIFNLEHTRHNMYII